MQQREAEMVEVSRTIWDYAEIGLLEFRSAKLLVEKLRAAGFTVEEGIADMPTAFVATWGTGKPVIGIMAEYDALPQCGPPVGENGHGCGHNLFGTASTYAAIATKMLLEQEKLPGTIRLFGTPAEETLVGKVYMARDGVFHGVDAMLTWHPGSKTQATNGSSAAMDSLVFEFFGKTAHAASDPWNGRSALDAVEVMNYAVNMLREHVIESARIHYVITDGGKAPNVVPAYARSWYFVRGPSRSVVNELVERVKRCAEAGALATDTELKITTLTAVYDRLPNRAGAELVQRNLELVGPPRFSEEENALARELGAQEPLDSTLSPIDESPIRGSSEEGNVSWITPLLHLRTACKTPDTPGHSELAARQFRTSIGEKGMMVAAKGLALSAWDCLTLPDALRKIRQEFEERTRGVTYDPVIPQGQKPPVGDGSTAP
ncbi:MAG: amidohydrolase [Nitrospinota bacterium]|nr:MAG: amidohydrolase [Nitrospinota bacterium]